MSALPNNPVSKDVEEFVDRLFGNREGFVYVPTKSPKSGFWQTYFFKYPQQRDDVVTHIIGQRNKDVYISPSFWKEPGKPDEDNWAGTSFAWVEFDGNAPDKCPEGIPEPSIKIQSSEPSHQHWYWELEEYQTDPNIIAGLAKQLAYTLQSDLSGWDSTQVLRPPGTTHQESRRRVRVLKEVSTQHKFADFHSLVDAPPDVAIDTDLGNLPDIQNVIAKYKWPEEALKLFKKKTQPVGSRSSAYTRLAFECIEMGMTNEEAYSILYNADERWKKFASRRDRAKRLTGIIAHARSKTSLKSELLLSDREPAYTLGDFLDSEIKVTWLYDDLLLDQGLGILSSLPGFGKSTLSFRLGLHTALNKSFLTWKAGKASRKKVGIFSFEMNRLECRVFLDSMMKSLTAEEQEFVRENVIIYPVGYSMSMASRENQGILLDIADQHGLDFFVLDSLKAISQNMKEEQLDKVFHFINKDLRNDRAGTVWLIHHNRKPEKGQPQKPRGLEDLYGDVFIGAHATAVLSLWRRNKSSLEVMTLKSRMAEESDPFVIQRLPGLDFLVLGNSKDVKIENEDEEGVNTGDAKIDM